MLNTFKPFLIGLGMTVILILLLVFNQRVGYNEGFKEGFCKASNGTYIGANVCDANGVVVYIPNE